MSKKIVLQLGRYQPYHLGHADAGDLAYENGFDEVIKVIGSVNKPRTIQDPFTFQERELMVRAPLSKAENDRTFVYGVEDSLYNDNAWLRKIQTIIKWHAKPGDEVHFVGGQKGEWYMKFFPEPQYKRLYLPEIQNINATDIRSCYFGMPWNHLGLSMEQRGGNTAIAHISGMLPESTLNFLDMFRKMPAFDYLCHEYEYYRNYWKELETYRWGRNALNMVTTDAVVIQSGHILMVQRKEYPGKGLYAIPGGFLNTDEYPVQGMVRELREETHLKLPEKVLIGNIQNVHPFTTPNRSLRGRIITFAHQINLPPETTLPKVKGGDDALKARWIPLSEIADLRDKMYEDHLDIIEYFVGELSDRPIIIGDNPEIPGGIR